MMYIPKVKIGQKLAQWVASGVLVVLFIICFALVAIALCEENSEKAGLFNLQVTAHD